ncbi:hypothetical protein Gpo141_00007025 [Globisporangium polare]
MSFSTRTQQQEQPSLRARGNGTFRISTSAEYQKNGSPEANLPPSAPSSNFNGKPSFSTPIRPILYHTCNSVKDNNLSDDDDAGDDGDVVFYKRFEYDHQVEEDGNNREFGTEAEAGGCCSSCSLSAESEQWRCVCVSPPLADVRLTSRSPHSRALSDMRLESIEGPLDAHNQQQQRLEDEEEGPEHQQEGFEKDATEQPQQDEEEDKEEDKEEAKLQGDKDNGGFTFPLEADSNQLSVEPIEIQGHHPSPLRRHRRKSSICCEPMVQYELVDSVCKSQQQLGRSRFARRPGSHAENQPRQLTASDNSFFSSNRIDDEDDDVMNIRSPVTQKPSGEVVTNNREQQREANVARHRPGWTPEQLLQYNEVLGFLQEACATRSPQISIPGARLAQMEQLLRSLHPKA